MSLAYADSTASSTTTGSNDVSPTMPATVNATDLLLLVVSVRNSGGDASVAAPAGWASVFDINDGTLNAHTIMFSKTAVGGDVAPVLHDASGGGDANLIWNMAIIRATGGGVIDAVGARRNFAALDPGGTADVATSQANGLVFGVIWDGSSRALSGGTNNTKIFGGLATGASFEIGGTNYTGSLAAAGTYTAAMTITPFANGGFMVAVSVKDAPAASVSYVSLPAVGLPIRAMR